MIKRLAHKILPQSWILAFRPVIGAFKKLIPAKLRVAQANRRSKRFIGMSTEEVFTDIHKRTHWSSTESASGTGSDLKNTKVLIDKLDALFVRYEVKSLLDIPCGDFNWIQRVDLSNINYLGGDIVQAIIDDNIDKYESDTVKFKRMDLVHDDLPKYDAILVRDCFVHLSYENIFLALENIKKSGCKYLLVTTFPDHLENFNAITGSWRTLNFETAPFSFCKPLELINEQYTGAAGIYKDKSLGIWRVEDINVPKLEEVKASS